jgi:hypothetical protein
MFGYVQEDDYNSTVSNNLRCENEYYIKEIIIYMIN